MEKWKKNAYLFGIGAVGYSLIEIAARGHTHWTMTLTGGICAVALYHAHRRLRNRSMWVRCGDHNGGGICCRSNRQSNAAMECMGLFGSFYECTWADMPAVYGILVSFEHTAGLAVSLDG